MLSVLIGDNQDDVVTDLDLASRVVFHLQSVLKADWVWVKTVSMSMRTAKDQIGVTTVSPALDNKQCWVAGEWRNVWVGRKDLIMQISWGIRSSPSWYEGCVLV